VGCHFFASFWFGNIEVLEFGLGEEGGREVGLEMLVGESAAWRVYHVSSHALLMEAVFRKYVFVCN
jgi:hypothetical protein